MDETVPLFADLLSLPLTESDYPPLALSPQQQRQQTQDSIVAWLLEQAEPQPVLVVWEDLHWADPSTSELLGLIIDQTPTVSMLHVLTFRPEFDPPRPTRSHMTPLTLNRLERPQVVTLITRLTGGKALPTEVMEHITTKTDGVPLFVEELTKMLLESTLLTEEANHYTLTGPLSAVTIPNTLQDSLMARLDRLPAAREIAQLGAVLGREFSYEMIHAITPLDDEVLRQSLTQLVDVELLYQRGRPPRSTYTFKHALIQDAAYASLLRRTRQQYHQQIAQVLETQFLEAVEAQPEVLAHHYTEAGAGEQAVTFWQRAGDRASRQSAYSEAIAHLNKGLSVLMTLPETSARDEWEIQIHLALGMPLTAVKGNADSEARRSYARIRELSKERKNPSLYIEALQGLRLYHTAHAEHRQAAEVVEETLQLAQSIGDPVQLAIAHHEVGVSLVYLGKLVPAIEHFKQGLAYADSQVDNAESYRLDLARPALICRCYLSIVLWELGYAEQSQRWCRDALALSQRISNLRLQSVANMWAVHLYSFRREWPILQDKARHLISFCSQHGLPQAGAVATIMLGWSRVLRDRDRNGLAQLQQGIQDFIGELPTSPRESQYTMA